MEKYPLRNKALSALLDEGETLKHPIYAVLEREGRRYTSYLGLTDGFLLIALTFENNRTWSARIPLDIKSLKIKKSNFFIQSDYEISIAFENSSPIKIYANKKVSTYGDQEEHINAFLAYLSDNAPKEEFPSLKDIKGSKFQRQYFDFILYLFLPFPLFAVCVITMVNLRHNEFVFANNLLDILYGMGLFLIILSPIFILSILNHVFGKIVSVINRDGIYLENDFVSWGKIEKITYIPEVFANRNPYAMVYRYTRMVLTVLNSSGEKYDIEVKNFPVYGLFKIKRLCPDKKIEFVAKDILFVVMIWITVMVVMLAMIFF